VAAAGSEHPSDESGAQRRDLHLLRPGPHAVARRDRGLRAACLGWAPRPAGLGASV